MAVLLVVWMADPLVVSSVANCLCSIIRVIIIFRRVGVGKLSLLLQSI
jgi:hypothetical protein